MKKKRSKYNACKTVVNGITFDSMREAERYSQLVLAQRAGAISDLELQPRFLLMPGFRYRGAAVRKIEYVADFRYTKNGETVIEDVKGMKTEGYKMKRKLFLQQYAEPNGWYFVETK